MDSPKRIVLRGRHGHRVLASADVPREWLQRLADDPEVILRETGTVIVKEGDTTLVTRAIWPMADRSVSVAYKCNRRISWVKQLTQWLGVNRALRSYLAGERLQDLGILTARPLAVILPPVWQRGSDSWIANEWIEEAEHVGAWVNRLGGRPEEAQLDDVARQLGHSLGRMHQAGGSHRDLKPENILVRLAGSHQPGCVWLIDLDGLQFRRPTVRRGRRRRDLSRLAVGVEEAGGLRRSLYLRFLKGYLAGMGRARQDWKGEWHALSFETRRRAAARAARRK